LSGSSPVWRLCPRDVIGHHVLVASEAAHRRRWAERAQATPDHGSDCARMLKRDGVVNGGERQGLAVDGQRERGIADQILDVPAVRGAPPDLDMAILARDHENLLDRGDPAVVGELDPAVVRGGRQ
jgi:hypothetical protein